MIQKIIILILILLPTNSKKEIDCLSLPNNILVQARSLFNPNDINLCVRYGRPDDSYYQTNYINAKSIKTFSVDQSTNYKSFVTYSEYSKDNKLIRYENPCFYGESGFVKFEYDQHGNRILEESPKFTTKIEYDKNNNIVKRTIIYKKSNNKCTISLYQHEGQIETFQTFDLNNDDTLSYIREFNDEGLLIRNGNSPSGTGITENYFYDNSGVLSKRMITSADVIMSTTKYLYNNCGLISVVSTFNEKGEENDVTKYEYEFLIDATKNIIINQLETQNYNAKTIQQLSVFVLDERGNWISKKIYKENILQTEYVREIEYF